MQYNNVCYFLQRRHQADGKVAAYISSNFVKQIFVTDPLIP